MTLASYCLISTDDIPRICASISVYGACFGFGCGFAVLGASILQLSDTIHCASTSMGVIFVYRGVGVLAGALVSLKVLGWDFVLYSKHRICSMLGIFAGITLAVISFVSSGSTRGHCDLVVMSTYCALFFVEGLCFGGIDAFSALSLSEMWGQRVQPWMQAKNLANNIGALIGPLLLTAYGFRSAFQLIAALSTLTLLGPLLGLLYQYLYIYLGHCEPNADLACEEIMEVSRTLHSISQAGVCPRPTAEECADMVARAIEEVQISRSACSTPAGNITRKTFFPSSAESSPRKMVMLPESEKSSPRNVDTFPAGSTHSSPRKQDLLPQSAQSSPRKRFDTAESYGAIAQSTQPGNMAHSPRKRFNSMESVGSQGTYQFHPWKPTLSFASTQLERQIEVQQEQTGSANSVGVVLVPYSVRLLLAAFAFWQLGLLCTFGGWVGTYVVSTDAGDSSGVARQAEVLTIFYTAQIVGSVVSVPASTVLSGSLMLRVQLGITAVAGVVMLLGAYSGSSGYVLTFLASGMAGSTLGCMLPLIMTIVNDYGATMTGESTLAVVLGGILGEAVMPYIVAQAIARYGAIVFPIAVCILIAAMGITYLALHLFLTKTDVVHYGATAERLLQRQDSPVNFEIASRSSSPIHLLPPRHPAPYYLTGGTSAHSSASSFEYTCGSNSYCEIGAGDSGGCMGSGGGGGGGSDHVSSRAEGNRGSEELSEWSDDAVEAAPLMLNIPSKCARSHSGTSRNGESLYARSFGARSNESLLADRWNHYSDCDDDGTNSFSV